MPVTNYFNQSRSTVLHDTPGLSQKIWVAPLSWFLLLQDPGADGVTIATDHTFDTTTLPDAGFVQLYALPKSSEQNGETSGDPGALNLNWKVAGFLPGDDAASQVMMKALKNEDLIVITEDAECPGGARYQFGCMRVPANISSMKPASGKRGEGSKGWAIEIEATERFIYSGVVTEMG